MSQIGKYINTSGGGGPITTLTTEDMVVVNPDIAGNINVVGDGLNTLTTGSNATHTVTVSLANNITISGNFTTTSGNFVAESGNLSITNNENNTNPAVVQIIKSRLGGPAHNGDIAGAITFE